jgi:IS30 family transposase
MAQHVRLRIDTGPAVFFCVRTARVPRPTKVNTSGPLRKYFPKSTDLSKHSPTDPHTADGSANVSEDRTMPALANAKIGTMT